VMFRTSVAVIFAILAWVIIILGYISTDLPLSLKILFSLLFGAFVIVPSFAERQNLR
jgi:hypothetical protein